MDWPLVLCVAASASALAILNLGARRRQSEHRRHVLALLAEHGALSSLELVDVSNYPLDRPLLALVIDDLEAEQRVSRASADAHGRARFALAQAPRRKTADLRRAEDASGLQSLQDA